MLISLPRHAARGSSNSERGSELPFFHCFMTSFLIKYRYLFLTILGKKSPTSKVVG